MVGWKDILRPIRDGLRDQLPPRTPKEDEGEREKRRRQRESDGLKGFAYFDTFEEIGAWTSDNAEPIQRANTPLLPRSKSIGKDDDPKARVVLIHDYAGNYHDYEDCQGSMVDKETYACEYMQYIDVFVYFSHKLVCVPPPSWTNALHRNGVRALGTFLVEPQSVNIGTIIERRASSTHDDVWEYPMATRLANMAEVYGFDGWLLNIEKTFPYTQWDCEKMVGFIGQLRSRLGHGNVIWYDALTSSNMLQYQNGLTTKNIAFAQAAGTLLTNYAWTSPKAIAAKELALINGMNPKNVVFGIDVWAQNSPAKENPRRTYGGGGTGTGVAVAKLAELGLSAGVFAPAWPFEHFPNCSTAVQRSMWEGVELPESLGCDCASQNQHAISEYRTHSITRFAQEFNAGSDSFFYTTFEHAFSSFKGPSAIICHLGAQSVLPTPTRLDSAFDHGTERAGVLSSTLFSSPSRLAISLNKNVPSCVIFESLKLFNLNLIGCLELTIAYRKAKTPDEWKVVLTLPGTLEEIKIPAGACEYVRAKKILHCTQDADEQETSTRLAGVGLLLEGDLSEMHRGSAQTVIEILEICVKRHGSAYPHCHVADLVLEHCGRQRKLAWLCDVEQGEEEARLAGLPWSSITGPISHFSILVDEEVVGRAYAMEYLLDVGIADKLDEPENHTIGLVGIGFDGTLLCSHTSHSRDLIQRRDERGSWQLVQHSELFDNGVTVQGV